MRGPRVRKDHGSGRAQGGGKEQRREGRHPVAKREMMGQGSQAMGEGIGGGAGWRGEVNGLGEGKVVSTLTW